MPNRKRLERSQGTLDIMVLQTLAALGPSHGYAKAARIEQVSGCSRAAQHGAAVSRFSYGASSSAASSAARGV